MPTLDFTVLKESFYQLSQIPMFILNEKLEIQLQSEGFPILPLNFFHIIIDKEEIKERFCFFYKTREVYILFQLEDPSKKEAFICIGPIVYNIPKNTSNLDILLLFQYGNIKNQREVLKLLPQLDHHLYQYLQLLYGLFYNEVFTRHQFHEYLYRPRDLKYRKQVLEIMFAQREDYQHTYTYHDELLMIQAIRKGDSSNARVYASKLASGRIGHMSADRLRKSKYAIIASVAIITRVVIEEGVSIENAYALSDTYINRVDEEYDAKKMVHIFFDAIMDFCAMVKLSQHHSYPVWVRTCMEYIDQHLHVEVTLEELGDVVHMAPAYISVQFKKIVGKSIKQYMNEQKIKEAKFLLQTTDLSIQEIALTLNYGTQSYFTKVFKEITGTLPNTYRNAKKH